MNNARSKELRAEGKSRGWLAALTLTLVLVANALAQYDWDLITAIVPRYAPARETFLTNWGTPLAYYRADFAQTNASGLVTNLPDLWVNGYNLTNPVTGTMPSISLGAVNGHAAIEFDGVDNYLRNMAYTNAAGTRHEYVALFRFRGPTNAATRYLFDGDIWNNMRNAAYHITGKAGTRAGSTITSTLLWNTNAYDVWFFSFAGSASQISSNNTSTVTVNPGAQVMSTLILGTPGNLAAGASMNASLVEFCTYSETNSGAVRTMIVSNLNYRYALGL